jgi:glycosyltransferase involved in cell wall biosynthesis
LEIILVDDGSPDNCPKICDDYAKKDNRVKVVHKKNGGLSDARNKGLKVSTGEYLSFIDSDDYINEEYYELMIKSIFDNKSDIAICDINVEYDDHTDYSKCYKNIFDKQNVINTPYAAAAWNKLYRRDIFKYIYPVGKINEDIGVTIPLIVDNNISYAEGALYYYVQRKGSIQNNGFNHKRFDIFDGVDLALERSKESKAFESIKDALVFNQIVSLFLYVIPKELDKSKRFDILNEYYELSKKYDLKNNKLINEYINTLSVKHKIYYKILFKNLYKCNIKRVNNTIQLYINIMKKGDK